MELDIQDAPMPEKDMWDDIRENMKSFGLYQEDALDSN